jgi:hypothetical protein
VGTARTTAPRYRKKAQAPSAVQSGGAGSAGHEPWDIPPVDLAYNRAAVAAQLSEIRLAPYLAAVGGDLERALTLYVWNARMAGALFEEIHYAEVFLRNALVAQLEVIAAANPSTAGGWYEAGFLDEASFAEISRAKEKLSRRHASPTEGRIIAELPLGFWHNLLASHEQRLWERGLYRAFVNLPLSDGNEHLEVAQRLHELGELRNRIAHHEPIFRRDHAADHCLILTLLGWISDDAAAWVEENGRVLEVSMHAAVLLRAVSPSSA